MIHNMGFILGVAIGLSWGIGYYMGMKNILKRLKDG